MSCCWRNGGWRRRYCRWIEAVPAPADDAIAYCAGQARRHDRERWLAALLAPAETRPALFALLAFNLELAKIREIASETMLGEIRLQWWRDAIGEIVDGRPRAHPVVQALVPAIAGASLSPGTCQALIDGRAADLDEAGPADMAALEAYAAATAGRLNAALAEVSGLADDSFPRAARRVGLGWGLIGLLRAVPFHARSGRVMLPADELAAVGVARRDVVEGRFSPALAMVVGQVAARALGRLDEARTLAPRVPAAARASLLPAALARAHRRALAKAGDNPFALDAERAGALAPLRLVWHAIIGRI